MRQRKYLSIIAAITVLIVLTGSSKQRRTHIFMIGDSTMSVKPEKAFPENGWGMALVKELKADVELKNHAKNGRSSKSFIAEGLWAAVTSELQPGDYVIIQFGHNDEKVNDSSRYTEPQTSFKQNLTGFIKETRQKGGIPVLCTPIVRRNFNESGVLVNTHGDYPQAIRELASELNVVIVDLNKLTEKKVTESGTEQSKKMFMILSPGEHPNFPEGKEDNTHLSEEGAGMVAGLFVEDVKLQQAGIAVLFK